MPAISDGAQGSTGLSWLSTAPSEVVCSAAASGSGAPLPGHPEPCRLRALLAGAASPPGAKPAAAAWRIWLEVTVPPACSPYPKSHGRPRRRGKCLRLARRSSSGNVDPAYAKQQGTNWSLVCLKLCPTERKRVRGRVRRAEGGCVPPSLCPSPQLSPLLCRGFRSSAFHRR